MSFEPQETGYSCGPAALRYALSLLGIAVTEAEVRAVIGKRWWHAVRGYGEAHLDLAAKKLGLTARARSWRDNPAACLKAMRVATSRGHVCVTTVHDDDNPHFHWMCIAGFEGPTRAVVLDPSTFDARLSTRTYRVLDPASERVPALMAASRLQAWLTPTTPGDGQFFLELWADSPRFPASFRWHEGLTWMMARHAHFAAHYDEYVDEMRGVFVGERGQSAAAFIESVRDRLLRTVRKHEAARFFNLELDAWAAITSAYGLKVKASEKQRAHATLAHLLGWRAAEFMYG